ncbi:hypothetical protein [Sneathiella litorea]|uniref:Uncharacterized protein n=1 Tax=Sneathiella litorea TaxID=2606216 RepID=A0A6L8WAY0_9PROT|nr:hypothetical protein [Sneathiella litorea]MZR32366.1 hypothetical protein [Sneathiella litorea]
MAVLLADINAAIAQATGMGEDEQDCKEYGVDYSRTEGLTKEEITDRMDKALFESLNKYDDCLQHSQSGGAASASGGSGAGAETDAGTSSSMASTGIQGTETSKATEQSSQAEAVTADDGRTEEQKQVETLQNGKLPDDIPPSDNDTVLQQKVKEAAINEPDPDKRARLWNEYRKLKGLSQI